MSPEAGIRPIEATAALAVFAVAVPFDFTAPRLVPAIGLSWVGVSLVLIWYIIRRGAVAPIPADIAIDPLITFYHSQIERQRTVFYSLWWWYFVPLFAGIAINLIVKGVALNRPAQITMGCVTIVTLLFFIAKLNHDRNHRLGEKIAALDAVRRRRLC